MRQWLWEHTQRQSDKTPLSFMEKKSFPSYKEKKEKKKKIKKRKKEKRNQSLQVISVFKTKQFVKLWAFWAYPSFLGFFSIQIMKGIFFLSVFIYIQSQKYFLKITEIRHLIWNVPLLKQWLTADFSVSLCLEIKTPDFNELEKLNLLSVEAVTPLLVYYGCLFLWN